MSWIDKLKAGLSKTSTKLTSGIDNIFNKRRLDQETAEELEDLLIGADLGTQTAKFLVTQLVEQYKFDKDIDEAEVKKTLSHHIAQILEPLAVNNITFSSKPEIIIMCGVNGNGKTTSIAKLANFYQQQGKTIILAACDTFRAAAVEQLNVWAQRLNLPIIIGAENSDPASIAYKAINEAIDKNLDLLLIDTAGRLHNKNNLMDEFAKIIKVVQKIDDQLSPKTILVIDATTGQNALNQIEKFNAIVKLSGLIITKLDGTAKGGIVIAIARKFNIPILAIGVGEKLDDLRPFSAQNFAENLLGLNSLN